MGILSHSQLNISRLFLQHRACISREIINLIPLTLQCLHLHFLCLVYMNTKHQGFKIGLSQNVWHNKIVICMDSRPRELILMFGLSFFAKCGPSAISSSPRSSSSSRYHEVNRQEVSYNLYTYNYNILTFP